MTPSFGKVSLLFYRYHEGAYDIKVLAKAVWNWSVSHFEFSKRRDSLDNTGKMRMMGDAVDLAQCQVPLLPFGKVSRNCRKLKRLEDTIQVRSEQ